MPLITFTSYRSFRLLPEYCSTYRYALPGYIVTKLTAPETSRRRRSPPSRAASLYHDFITIWLVTLLFFHLHATFYAPITFLTGTQYSPISGLEADFCRLPSNSICKVFRIAWAFIMRGSVAWCYHIAASMPRRSFSAVSVSQDSRSGKCAIRRVCANIALSPQKSRTFTFQMISSKYTPLPWYIDMLERWIAKMSALMISWSLLRIDIWLIILLIA